MGEDSLDGVDGKKTRNSETKAEKTLHGNPKEVERENSVSYYGGKRESIVHCSEHVV